MADSDNSGSYKPLPKLHPNLKALLGIENGSSIKMSENLKQALKAAVKFFKTASHSEYAWARYICSKCENENDVLHEFMLYLGSSGDTLANDLHLLDALNSSDEERPEKIRNVISIFFGSFKTYLTDNQRRIAGTFHNLYHKIQSILHANRYQGWQLYGQQSKYYGPEGLRDPEEVTLHKENIPFQNVPLPATPPPEKELFSGKKLWPLASHFYTSLQDIPDLICKKNFALAICNYANWLTMHYNILKTTVSISSMQPDDDAQDEDTQLSSMEYKALTQFINNGRPVDDDLIERVESIGREVAERMPPEMQVLYVLCKRNMKKVNIAPILGLAGAPGVSKRLENMTKFLEAESYKYEELQDSDDDDSLHKIQQLFMDEMKVYLEQKVISGELKLEVA